MGAALYNVALPCVWKDFTNVIGMIMNDLEAADLTMLFTMG